MPKPEFKPADEVEVVAYGNSGRTVADWKSRRGVVVSPKTVGGYVHVSGVCDDQGQPVVYFVPKELQPVNAERPLTKFIVSIPGGGHDASRRAHFAVPPDKVGTPAEALRYWLTRFHPDTRKNLISSGERVYVLVLTDGAFDRARAFVVEASADFTIREETS